MSGARATRAGILAVFLAGLAGCASSGPQREVGVGLLDESALAFRRGEFDRAREGLVEVRRTCGEARLGRHALLLVAALEVDPRNAAGDPDRAAALAGHWLTRPETFPWLRPIAETIYLQALRAGGLPYSASGKPPGGVAELLAMDRPAAEAGEACEGADWEVAGGGEPPAWNGHGTRPGAASGARGLQADNTQLRNRVAELEAELERIRETLLP